MGIPGGTFRIRLNLFRKNVPPTVLGISGNTFRIRLIFFAENSAADGWGFPATLFGHG
jgi:hypothetical protein